MQGTTSCAVLVAFLEQHGTTSFARYATARGVELNCEEQPFCDGVKVSLASGGSKCIEPGSGESFRDCADCPEMVVVPAGSFMMGSSEKEIAAVVNDFPGTKKEWLANEGPKHRVTIAKPFAVGKFEVTWDEWEACVAGSGCDNAPVENAGGDNGWGKGRRPVIEVSWNDAKAYVKWLSGETGQSYRLLSEAEWEYAARAGTQTRYHWGDRFSSSKVNNGSQTVKVGQYPPNAWGLHDVHGNVWEWVEDCYAKSYIGAPDDGSARTDGECTSRVLRGGSWNNNTLGLRAASRIGNGPDIRNGVIGFRLARTLHP